eukprot:scaffold379751_cov59-Attheya_sp.AAC.3
MGGFSGQWGSGEKIDHKAKLLQSEGVTFTENGVITNECMITEIPGQDEQSTGSGTTKENPRDGEPRSGQRKKSSNGSIKEESHTEKRLQIMSKCRIYTCMLCSAAVNN